MNSCFIMNSAIQLNSLEYLPAYIAIIVSIFSLGYSVYQGRKTLRLTELHNRKSVEPMLTTRYKSVLKSDIEHCAEESFQIMNCGFGHSKNKLKENNTADSIKEIYDKRSDNMICGFSWCLIEYNLELYSITLKAICNFSSFFIFA